MAIEEAIVSLKPGFSWTSQNLGGSGITTVGRSIHSIKLLLGVALRQQNVRLCSEKGSDMTEDIMELLEDPMLHYLTDILLQTDSEGNYQAMLLGDVEMTEDNSMKVFHFIFLCSVQPGMGVELINKVKEHLKEDKTLSAITLEPLKSVVDYYKKQGFAYINESSTDTMIWKPTSGGNRRTRKNGKTHRR